MIDKMRCAKILSTMATRCLTIQLEKLQLEGKNSEL
jgi:hypothetical protein